MSDLELAIEVISREVMEGYECVRQSGLVNMFDFDSVLDAAQGLEVGGLEYVTLEEYKLLIGNFCGLMRHYGISQRRRQHEETCDVISQSS